MGRHITQVVTGHWALGSWCTEHGEYKHCRMVPTPLNTAHPAVALHLLQTSCHHHAHQCSDTGDYQQTVTVTVTLTRSMFVTVCRPPVTSGIIVVVLPNLALEAGNQPGNSGAARGLAPGPVSAGCRGLALRMSPDRPGAVPMWQLWAGKVCQDTATITFIDHSRSNKFASVITGRLCSKAHFWHWACKHSDSAISIIMNFELKTFQIIK